MKMDRKLVSKERWEVRYIFKKYPAIPKEVVIAIARKAGRSRIKLYQLLLEWTLKNLT